MHHQPEDEPVHGGPRVHVGEQPEGQTVLLREGPVQRRKEDQRPRRVRRVRALAGRIIDLRLGLITLHLTLPRAYMT